MYLCEKTKIILSNIISITAISSVSSLGHNAETIWNNYKNGQHFLSQSDFLNQKVWVSKLDKDTNQLIEELRESDSKYKSLDRSVLFAIAVSRSAMQEAGWNANDNFGINIGSSRGATELFEKHHLEFIQTGKAQTLASPTTTLGNISSWVSHDLQTQGPEISHSITCSTALHAMLNGVAWLRAGMCDKFMVGGSEAPLTDFTIAQMQALKIYAREEEALRQAQCDNDKNNLHNNYNSEYEVVEHLFYPCRALDLEKIQNSMVLGEGAAVCCLELGKSANALAFIESFGYATEILEHNISISTDAKCFQKSMKMALRDVNLSEVDAIVMHAPGTKAGDSSEYKAIQNVFGIDLPMLTTNKWKIGHTFGASGILSIELAIMMMRHQEFIAVPYIPAQPLRKSIRKVLVNAVGFGGNAVSILLKL